MSKNKKSKKQSKLKMGLFGLLGYYLGLLNNSKFFSGLIMIFMNIGSKYITIEFSKSQEAYLRNSMGRQFLIFAISWMGTRDILMALGLTAVFNVLANHLFNEDSKFCIIPHKYRNYENILDLNKDNKVTDKELEKAKKLLATAEKKEIRREKLRNLNNFKLLV
jgi:hypothetical protein